MMKIRMLPTLVLLATAMCAMGQRALQRGLQQIDRQHAESIIGYLADDALLGREAGTPSGHAAGAFLVAMMKEIGLEPLYGESYYQPFSANVRTMADTVRHDCAMRNVLGILPGKVREEYVVVCAHYDHLGIDPRLEGDNIYNGADDNASGVQAVLQIARAMKSSGKTPQRSILFALWDGEEKGLLGSKYFLENCEWRERIKACLNFDMIGRNNIPEKPRHVVYFYAAQMPEFGEWTKRDVARHRLDLEPDYRPHPKLLSGSDNASFVRHGIPFMWYHTDGHPDYHRPTDHPDRLNWEKMLDITRSAYLNTWHLANDASVSRTLSTLVPAADFLNQAKATPGAVLLDVRTPQEYEEGHLEGAVLLDWKNKKSFRHRAKRLDKSQPLYIYCKGGVRSAMAGRYFIERGFSVYELEGGYDALK